MMIRKIDIYVLALTLMFTMVGMSWAGEGWQLEIVAKAKSAENKLVIGQSPTASDSVDGRHDIPALLGGDIQSYMTLDGQELWKDLRASCMAPCEKQWRVVVMSPLTGERITLSWDSNKIPANISLLLLDKATGFTVDMKQETSIVFDNTGRREFVIIGQNQ